VKSEDWNELGEFEKEVLKALGEMVLNLRGIVRFLSEKKEGE